YLNKSVSDIDILIKKSSFSNLKKTLEKLDYHQLPSSTPSNEISFVKKTSTQTLTIDIHFRAIRSALNPLFRHPLEPKNMTKLTSEFWKSSSPQKDNLYFLKNEYLLLYFCLNSLFHHGLRGADLLATISTIITTEKINWQNFWDLVKKYHFTNFVYYPLGWSSRLFKTKVPNLKHHRPNIFRRFFIKLLINQHTVFRPFHSLGKDYFSSRINVILIFVIRLFLYEK
ncbi:nucleotidyltransferase family protein, partial [Patescibacteria group bacterium]|nr:nucleotidyltransferase family protein [Patescibacteria group bacterium]